MKMLRIPVVAVALLVSACGHGYSDYQYTIWIGMVGYYTDCYEISDGVLRFVNTDGVVVTTNNFKVVPHVPHPIPCEVPEA